MGLETVCECLGVNALFYNGRILPLGREAFTISFQGCVNLNLRLCQRVLEVYADMTGALKPKVSL